MKSKYLIITMLLVALLATTLLTLSCGQKGSLYLPDSKQQTQKN